MTKIETLDKNGTVAESIKLAKMIFSEDFTKRQLDLILIIIAKAKEHHNELEYTIPFSEIAKLYNPKNPRTQIVKDTVTAAVKGLMKSYFTIYSKDGKYTDYYHWAEKTRIDENEELVYIKLSEDVKKFYLQLHKQALFYSIKNIIKLKTLTEARIYHWAYGKKGFANDVPLSIEDAKMLFVGHNMRTADFMRTLNAALKRIYTSTDLRIYYEKVCADKTQKQRITSLKFTIDCTYTKEKKVRTTAQARHDKKRNIKMWQELIELREEVSYLSQRNYELEINELNRERTQRFYDEMSFDLLPDNDINTIPSNF